MRLISWMVMLMEWKSLSTRAGAELSGWRWEWVYENSYGTAAQSAGERTSKLGAGRKRF